MERAEDICALSAPLARTVCKLGKLLSASVSSALLMDTLLREATALLHVSVTVAMQALAPLDVNHALQINVLLQAGCLALGLLHGACSALQMQYHSQPAVAANASTGHMLLGALLHSGMN